MWDQNNNAESIKEHNAQPLNLYFIWHFDLPSHAPGNNSKWCD